MQEEAGGSGAEVCERGKEDDRDNCEGCTSDLQEVSYIRLRQSAAGCQASWAGTACRAPTAEKIVTAGMAVRIRWQGFASSY